MLSALETGARALRELLASAADYGELQRDFHKVWIVTLLALSLPLVRTRRIPQALAAAFAFTAAFGIFQALTMTYGDEPEIMRVRAHAFVHAVTYGQQMALAILGILCFWRKPEAGADGPRGLGATLVLLALCLGAMLLSQTRGALVALAGGFGALCLVSRPHRRLIPLAIAGAAAGAFAMERLVSKWRSFFTAITLTGIDQGDSGLNPNFHRFILWKTALRMFQDRPVFGLGPGNFHSSFINYFRGKVDGEWIWNSAHNLYLHHLAERGLVGAAALLIVIVVFTGRSWRRARRDPSPWNLWAFSAWGAFWVMNLTEVSFQVEILMTLMLFIELTADAVDEGQARKN